MEPPERGSTHPIAYYSIYRPLKDERLSWPSRLTYSGRLTHISGHPSAAGRAWDRKVRRSKTNVLTTVQRNQLNRLMHVKVTDSQSWRSVHGHWSTTLSGDIGRLSTKHHTTPGLIQARIQPRLGIVLCTPIYSSVNIHINLTVARVQRRHKQSHRNEPLSLARSYKCERDLYSLQ